MYWLFNTFTEIKTKNKMSSSGKGTNVDSYILAKKINDKISFVIDREKTREIINAFSDVILETLMNGQKVSLHKLGTFDTKIIPAISMVSSLPHIKGQLVERPARFSPTFNFSSSIKKKVKKKEAYYHNEKDTD